MADLVSVIAVLGVCGLGYWLLSRIEPHWSSRDGHRMIARAQALGPFDVPEGTWKEVRAFIDGDLVHVTGRGPLGRRLRGRYRPVAKSQNPPARREIYILQGDLRILLRLPSSSRSIVVIDELM